MRNEKSGTAFLVVAGLYNILGMLIFSRFCTSDVLTRLDPQTFSTLGEVSIVLWGAAYLSVSRVHRQVSSLLVVFALEKMVYVFIWARWLLAHHGLLDHAPFMARFFFSVYGFGDLVFGVGFAMLASYAARVPASR